MARAPKLKDVAIVFDRTEDRQGLRILRRRSERHAPELGEVHPLREGQPIRGELISLKPRKDVRWIYDVKTELPEIEETRALSGPAQVATRAYRQGWEGVFGDGPARPDLPVSKPN